MILAVASLSVALILTVSGPALLRRVGDDCRLSPRGMLAMWTLATSTWLLIWGTLLSLLLAKVMGPGMKGVLTACVTLVQALHRNRAELWVPLLLAGGTVFLARLLWVALRRTRRVARWRRGHHRELLSCARTGTVQKQRVWLLESKRPDVYCIPGDRVGIVVTQGAVDALTPGEMRAVLAHERAHLRGRHHSLVAWVRFLAEAFPSVPLLRAAAEEVPILVEWAADDQAARTVGVTPLAHALGAMASSPEANPDAEALAVSGACTVQRVRRLLTAPPTGPSGLRRLFLTTTTLTVLVAPPVLMLASMLASVVLSQCSCAA